MPTLNKLEYLDETKSQIRTALNQFEAGITEEDTFRSYVSKINVIYNNWAKVTGEDTSITLNNTKKGKMLLETAPSELTQETTTGKNLAGATSVSGNITQSNDVFTYANNSTGSSFINLDTQILEANTEYKMELFIIGTTANTKTVEFLLKDENNTNIFDIYRTFNANISYSFTPSSNKTISKFQLANSTSNPTDGAVNFKLQIRKASTTEGYEQYSGGIPQPNPSYPSEVQVIKGNNSIKVENKNLFNKSNTSQILNAYINGDKLSSNDNMKTLYIPSKPSTTYTISRVAGTRFAVAYCTNVPTPSNTSQLRGNLVNNTATSITITTDGNGNYLCVYYYNSGSDTLTEEAIRNSIQIEYGSTATSYVAHQEQVLPLNLPNGMEYCKIGTYEDEFEHDGDKWYLNKAIGKVVLNGSESNWGTIGDNRYYLPISDKRYLTTQVPCLLFSNYFKAIQYAGGTVGIGEITEGYYTTGNNNVFFNYNGSNTDLAGFKTWLSTHNTDLYYILSTPTHTEITDSTLISQLNAIEQALSYDEQTNISQTNTGLPFVISASALMKGGN